MRYLTAYIALAVMIFALTASVDAFSEPGVQEQNSLVIADDHEPVAEPTIPSPVAEPAIPTPSEVGFLSQGCKIVAVLHYPNTEEVILLKIPEHFVCNSYRMP